MKKHRLEAFSDGVLAIIITIMVLEMAAPAGDQPEDLKSVLPTFLGYVLSYAYVAIVWLNHHRLFRVVNTICERVLWANMFWMFCVSLVPFATSWMSATHFAKFPTSFYCFILLVNAIAYHILYTTVKKAEGEKTNLYREIFENRKSVITISVYALSIFIAMALPAAAGVMLAVVTLSWIVDDIWEGQADLSE